MLEPQGTLFFLLLMMAFGGLVLWLALTKQMVFRVLAACLAFIPAMVFGIAAVNKYYDYYQTWGALFADLSGQSTSIPQISAASLGPGVAKTVRSEIAGTDPALDAQLGLLFEATVAGPASHLTRHVYVYLPPQYFSKAYAHYRFPAIELLHGSPGEPTTWVNVMDVIPIFKQLLASHRAQPAVLVMPDTDGGQQYSLQCLNDPHGLQDMTFVGKEVPQWVTTNLRVQRPGLMWGIAGYSEGGYCAANIGLQYAKRFGYAGVLSGYFAPIPSQVPFGGKPGGKPHDINVFLHNKRLLMLNTPDDYILKVPLGVVVPSFFLAAGADDPADVRAAQYFRQLLLTRVADPPQLMIVNGGGHQARVWRAALIPMLAWMTTQLAYEVQHFALAEREAARHHHVRPVPTKPVHRLKPPGAPVVRRTPAVRPTRLSPAPIVHRAVTHSSAHRRHRVVPR